MSRSGILQRGSGGNASAGPGLDLTIFRQKQLADEGARDGVRQFDGFAAGHDRSIVRPPGGLEF